ncbi:unnamed protein product [Orchesella dallaii]|uniref:E3 UFM1-protein ligase 1 homolog n=1 Tax=Orchesella dallaii TaxID=48710 RepID=A0ABP1RC03_9HEXA
MSNNDWEEVKRLAADFQRAQLTAASQRLTERNCVEIVNKLIELKLLDVVFTSDGKEYVTPQQLNREIQDELYVHGGRLSLTALSQTLGVGLAVVEARVSELLRQDKALYLVLGQLVTSAYLDSLCEELDEKLSQDGLISVSELSKSFDLPGDFLQEQLSKRLGKLLHGRQDDQDPSLIYTETFVRRNTARIRGILSAVTKPTPINPILSKFSNRIPEKLFFTIVDRLISTKRIEGIISGGGSSRSSYFIPAAYSRAQIQWIEGFMNGNGYVDLDAASRLGISDPKAFISKRYPSQQLIFLKSVVLGESLYRQVKESVEESLESPGWIDVSTVLPVSVNGDDVQRLLDSVLAGVKDAVVFDTFIVHKPLIQKLRSSFSTLMTDKAVKDISSGKYIQLVNEARALEAKQKSADFGDEGGKGGKKDERRKKAAGGKAGGGTQGRETKTKSTKKKYMAGKHKDDDWSDSEEDTPKSHGKSNQSNVSSDKGKGKKGPSQLDFMSVSEIQKVISKNDVLNDAVGELLESLAQYINGGLQEEYQAVLKTEFDKFMSEKCGKKSQEEVLDKLYKLTSFFQLYNEGLSQFDGDIKNQLEKFLLRSSGQEIVVAATTFVLMEAGLDENSQLTDLPDGTVKDSILALGKSGSASAFLECLETVLPPAKKSAKAQYSSAKILVEARKTLLQELDNATTDPALYLHITTLILFSLKTDSLLQASGKFVPQIIAFLSTKLERQEHLALKDCQEKVVGLIKMKNSAGSEDARDELLSTLPCLKNIVEKCSKL